MKRLAGILMVLLLLGSAAALWYPRASAPHVQSAFEAAALLEQDVRAGGDGVRFRSEEIDPDEVYRALEARYPYAFALHATTRPDRTTELRVEVSRMARQEQAREYAQALAAESVSEGMTEAEKLRALHDALVRLCEYDLDTAQEPAPDGATRAFCSRRRPARPQGRMRGLWARIRYAVRGRRAGNRLRRVRGDEPRLECRAPGRPDLVYRLHV